MSIQRMTGKCMQGLLVACVAISILGSAWARASAEDAVKSGLANTLTIGAPSATSRTDRISVPVTLNVRGLKPSLIIFGMDYDPNVIVFHSVTRGPAAVAAGKYAEANETALGSVSFIVWALNSEAMNSGLVLTATFDLALPGTRLERVFIEGTNPSMADVDGHAVAVRMVYFAPASVTVSAAQHEGVLVQWTAVAGASLYRVLRSESEDTATVESISDALPASTLSFVDDSAAATTPPSPGSCPSLFYWVVAQHQRGMEGTLSEPATWHPGSPVAPANVTVSSVDTGGALIEWSTVDGAAGYQVYRGLSDDLGLAAPISDWLPDSALSYLDEGVSGGTCTVGCVNVCRTYYYWVRARSASGCEGAFSVVAPGRNLRQVFTKSPASVIPGLGIGRPVLGDLLVLGLAGAGLLAARRVAHFHSLSGFDKLWRTRS